MNDELRAILDGREREFEAAMADRRLDEVGERRIVVAVRTRLRMRRVSITGAAAAGALVLGVGVWLALGSTPPAPPASPDPTSSVSASTSAEPSPSATPSVGAPEFSSAPLTGGDFLPAEPMTADVWESVDAGWTLTVFAPADADGMAAVYLVDPAGARFEVQHWEMGANVDGGYRVDQVAAWEPRTTTAIARASNDAFTECEWGVLDLISGEFDPSATVVGCSDALGTTPDGNVVINDSVSVTVVDSNLAVVDSYPVGADSTAPVSLSPDGTLLLEHLEGRAQVRDASSGDVLYEVDPDDAADVVGPTDDGPYACDVTGWLDGATPAVVCTAPATISTGAVARTWVFGAGPDGLAEPFGFDSEYQFVNLTPVPDGVVGLGLSPSLGTDGGRLYLLGTDGATPWAEAAGVGELATVTASGEVAVIAWDSFGTATGSLTGWVPAANVTVDVMPNGFSDAALAPTTRYGSVLVGSRVTIVPTYLFARLQ